MQGKTIHPVVADFMENRKTILKALHQLSEAIYVDACDHGLWEDPTVALDNPNGMICAQALHAADPRRAERSL